MDEVFQAVVFEAAYALAHGQSHSCDILSESRRRRFLEAYQRDAMRLARWNAANGRGDHNA